MSAVGTRDIVVTTDLSRLDLDAVHGFLTQSYWARGIPRDVVVRAVENSLCFGVLDGERQIGFARVVTDRATYAYVCDVFVLESERGRGVGTCLMRAIKAHSELQSLRRWTLSTRDAHGLYEQFGFRGARHPERLMEILEDDPYGGWR